MIGYLEGRVLARRERFAIVLTPGGVGYELELPAPVAASLPAAGGQTALFVHTVVREDALELFGFATLEDRETFRVLISISKLGPRTGLAILSQFTTDDLLHIVAAGDAEALIRVPGIGKKSAQRIFIELSYKLEGRAPTAGPAMWWQVLPISATRKPRPGAWRPESLTTNPISTWAGRCVRP